MQAEVHHIHPGLPARIELVRQMLLNAAACEAGFNREYLVKGWLGRSGIALLYGDSNVGKTFFALDLAFHVAAGRRWQGHRVTRVPVLYLATEGGGSVRTRIAAMKVGHAELQAEGAPCLDLLPMAIDLGGPIDVQAIIHARPDTRYGLIVIDTLAQSFGGGNENESRDMGLFLRNVAQLRDYYGCQVLIVHHSGKDAARGARGHSSLRAAVDTEIELKREGSVRVATATKQRDLQTDGKVAYTLQQVCLGMDDEGDRVTSCVVVPAIAPLKHRQLPSGFAEIALQGLYEVLREHGRNISNSENYPGNRRIVEIAKWRNYLFETEADGDKTDESVKKAIQRARRALKKKNFTREFDGKVWLVGGDYEHGDMEDM